MGRWVFTAVSPSKLRLYLARSLHFSRKMLVPMRRRKSLLQRVMEPAVINPEPAAFRQAKDL
jgi:hypothetical protein